MRKYPSVPHPFVLVHRQPADTDGIGARVCELLVTLIGRGHRHLGSILNSFRAAAAGPRGVSGNRMELISVRREEGLGSNSWQLLSWADLSLGDSRLTSLSEPLKNPWQELLGPSTDSSYSPQLAENHPEAPERVTLQFLTPLRVKRDGLRVGPREFRFADLFVNLMRRISMLTYFHTSQPLEADFRGLAEAAKVVEAKTHLEWRDLGRYSSRQQGEMQMGGVLGTITVQDPRLPMFWPYLWLGQWTHAGTGATMGLGRYVLCASLHTAASRVSSGRNSTSG
jgi:hypothetical protein